jgi:hypothetical protein
MSAGDVVILIAAIACLLSVAGLLVVVGSLRHQVRDLARISDDLRLRTVPLVAEAHRVVDQAASEMDRVGAVLDSTGSVHTTVDSASRLAYRAFANPVVKVLAVRAGAAGGIRRLRARPVASSSQSGGSGTPGPRPTTRAAGKRVR